GDISSAYDTQSKPGLVVLQCIPVAVLTKPAKCTATIDKNEVICRCISWSSSAEQSFLAAGYGNGLISVFNLNCTSELLVSINPATRTRQIKPEKCWLAHGI